MSPTSNDWCLTRRGEGAERHRIEGDVVAEKQRSKLGCHTAKIPQGCKRQRKANSPPEPPGAAWGGHLGPGMSGLQNCERICFCGFRPPSLWHFAGGSPRKGHVLFHLLLCMFGTWSQSLGQKQYFLNIPSLMSLFLPLPSPHSTS